MSAGGRCVPDFFITFVRQVFYYFIILVIDLLPPGTQRPRLHVSYALFESELNNQDATMVR